MSTRPEITKNPSIKRGVIKTFIMKNELHHISPYIYACMVFIGLIYLSVWTMARLTERERKRSEMKRRLNDLEFMLRNNDSRTKLIGMWNTLSSTISECNAEKTYQKMRSWANDLNVRYVEKLNSSK